MADKVGSIYVDIGANLKDFESKMKTATSKLNDFGKRANEVGSKLSLRVTAPVIAAGAASIKMASDYVESLNKVDVAFGNSSGIVQDFAEKSLRSFGIAEGSALNMAALFGDMATSMGISQTQAAGMSSELVGLAGDLSSFKNIRLDVAETALKSIFTGETESLKNLGIVMTQANLEAFALSEGITQNIKDMSEAEKVNLRYAFVLEKTKNAQGDFARTNEGAANQMRIFQESMKELGQSFGSIILPAFTKIVKSINGFIQRLGEMDDSTKKTIVTVAALAAAVGPLLIVFGQMSMGLSAVIGVMGKFTSSATAMTAAARGLSLALKGGVILALTAGTIRLIEYANGTRKTAKEIRELAAATLAAGKGLKNMNEQLGETPSAEKITQDFKNYQAAVGITEKQIARLNHKTLKETRDRLMQMAQMDSVFLLPFGGIDTVNEKLAMVNKQIGLIESNFSKGQLEKSFELLQEKADAFGWSAEKLAEEKLALLDGAINDLIEGGKQGTAAYTEMVAQWRLLNSLLNETEAPEPPELEMDWSLPSSTPTLPTFQTLDPDSLVPVNEESLAPMDAVYDKLEGLRNSMRLTEKVGTQVAQAVSQAFASMGQQLFSDLNNSENAFERFAGGLATTITKIISMLLSNSIALAIKGGMESSAATGPAAIFTAPAFIATAVSGVLSAFASIPKFAEGGAVTGPTLAMIGEKPGSRGEAIIPFEKIPKLFNEMGSLGQNMMVEVRGVLDGDVIRLVQNRAVTDNALVR